MDKLIERAVGTNTRCYTCGGLVYAVEKKQTTNHVYHNRCFRCRICKRNLTGSSLNEEGDDIYCTNCYRKKQRGDCNSLDFQRAANERAQYVHNPGHPDQPPPSPNPRSPVRHGFLRHPSLSLHQLERRFLSYQEPNTKDFEKLNKNYQKFISVSHPLTIKTSFSAPVHLTSFRRNSSLIIDESSPSLHFSPVFSPSLYSNTGSTATTPKTAEHFKREKINSSTNGIQYRLNRSNIDLTNTKTPPIQPRHSIATDANQKYENKDRTESIFLFPNKNIIPIRRRSSNINYVISPLKIK